MAKLVDALPSGGSVRKDVLVRIQFWALKRGCLKRIVSLCHSELVEELSKAINLIVSISSRLRRDQYDNQIDF
jgi:hypothetical protein